MLVVMYLVKIVVSLDGKVICFGGYLVLLENDVKGCVIEFFLVFYLGVCIYVLLLLLN